jgi:hypothetical protein
MTVGLELIQGSNVYVVALALIYDITVPVQAESIQSTQDAIHAAGHNTRCIEIFDAQQPAAAMVARIEKTSDRCQKRAEVQVARG